MTLIKTSRLWAGINLHLPVAVFPWHKTARLATWISAKETYLSVDYTWWRKNERPMWKSNHSLKALPIPLYWRVNNRSQILCTNIQIDWKCVDLEKSLKLLWNSIKPEIQLSIIVQALDLQIIYSEVNAVNTVY